MKLLKKTKLAQKPGRNRPLSGTEVPNRPAAFSYYAQRSSATDNLGRDQNQSDIATKQRQINQPPRKPLVLRLIGLIGVCLLILNSLWLSSTPKIVVDQAVSNLVFQRPSSEYAASAHQALSRSLLNQNKLSFNSAGLSQALRDKYPEIRQVSVGLPLFSHQPTVYIEPYQPAYVLKTSTGSSYVLDTTGRALADASRIPAANLKLLSLTDQSGHTVVPGKPVLPGTTVAFARLVVAALQAKAVKVGALTLPAASSELDVAISGQPYFVKFNLQDDAKQQAGTFLAVKQRLDSEHITPSQYIDVRVGAGRTINNLSVRCWGRVSDYRQLTITDMATSGARDFP